MIFMSTKVSPITIITLTLAMTLAAVSVVARYASVLSAGDVSGVSTLRIYYSLSIVSDLESLPVLPQELIHAMNQTLGNRVILAGIKPEQGRIVVGKLKYDIHIEAVTASYFSALGLVARGGKFVSYKDVAQNQKTIVLNAKLAESMFGHPEDAIGREVVLYIRGVASLYRVIGLVSRRFHGIGAGGRGNTSAWIPVSRSDRHLITLVSAPRQIAFPQLVERIVVALRFAGRDLSLNYPPGFHPILIRPFTLYNHQRMVSLIKVLFLYRDYISFLAVALIANAFFLQMLIVRRTAIQFRLERILGATKHVVVVDYLFRSARHFAVIVLTAIGGYIILALLMTHFALLAESDALVQKSSLIAASIYILTVATIAALVIELPQLWEGLNSESAWIGDEKLTVKMGSLPYLVVFASAFGAAIAGCVVAWSIAQAYKDFELKLGVLTTPSMIVMLQTKASGESNLPKPSGVVLLRQLKEVVKRVDPAASFGLGPIPGSLFSYYRDTSWVSGYVVGHHVVSSSLATPVFVSPGWFDAAGVRFLAGHNFHNVGATSGSFNIIIDSTMAKDLFGGVRRSIGRTFINGHNHPVRVVGVTNKLYMLGGGEGPTPILFYNIAIASYVVYDPPIIVLTGGKFTASQIFDLRSSINRALNVMHSSLEVRSIENRSDVIARIESPVYRISIASVLFSVLIWLLALSSVNMQLRVFFETRKRVHAIQSAIGADPRRLYSWMLLVTLGIAVAGIAASLLIIPWMAAEFALLTNELVKPFGWPTWIALGALLLAVFLVTHFPARRAARAEPAASLHEL